MKKTIIAGLICIFSTTAMAQETCVDYLWHVDTGKLFDEWVNNCPYSVLIKGTFNNGYVGMWGPLRPGEKDLSNPGSSASSVSWSYCNFSNNAACSP